MSTLLDPARPKFPMKPIGVLSGYQNGRLDNRVLAVSTVRGLKLNVVSVRKFNALQALAVKDGIALSSTGDYRNFTQQELGLLARYDRGYFPGRADYNYYQGVVWSLKPGLSPMATPGTSNHGTGRARDFAEMVNGDTIPDSLTVKAKLWLASNAPDCGIFFEVKSEDWHGTDFAGDDFSLAPAVLAYEKGELGPQIPVFAPAIGQFSLYPFDPNKATLRLQDPPMCSDLVSYMQGVMRVRLGYAINVDGWFGQISDDHVRWFQASHGLTVDGVCGPKTWAKLDSYA